MSNDSRTTPHTSPHTSRRTTPNTSLSAHTSAPLSARSDQSPAPDSGSEPLPAAQTPFPHTITPAGIQPLSTRQLLQTYPVYRRVWFGSFASNLGGWMEIVGVQWAMAQATLDPAWINSGRPAAPIMMGFLAAAQLLPQLFFGLVGGVVADRMDRRLMLLLTQVARMLVAAALCVLAWVGILNPYMLLILGAADGIASAFNLPAWQVLTPRLVGRKDLPTAIALNGLQFNLARAVGPALAGVVLGLSLPWIPGIALVFLINTISFVAFIIAVWRTPPDTRDSLDATNSSTFASAADAPPVRETWTLIREALDYARRHRGVLALILGLTAFSTFAAPLLRFLPILVKEVYVPGAELGAQERVFGLLLGLMGLGAVVGVLTLKHIPPWYPRHHFVPLSMTLGAISIALLAAVDSVPLACTAMFFVGIFWLWSFNQSYSALQLLVPDRLRGRVSAIANIASLASTPVGAILGGVVGTILAGRDYEGLAAVIALGFLSLCLLVASILMLTFRTPEIDAIDPAHPAGIRRPGLLLGVLASTHRPRH